MDDHHIVKIADFGVARIIETTGHMTAETGTYRWMAPEVCLGAGPLGQALLEVGPEVCLGAGPWGEAWLEVGPEVGLGAVLQGDMLGAGASSCVDFLVGRGNVRACSALLEQGVGVYNCYPTRPSTALQPCNPPTPPAAASFPR